LPDTPPRDVATATTYTLRRLAHRIQALTHEAHDLQQQTTTLIEAFAPTLLQRNGVGPDSAAALLITAGDNPDRLASEASFAALCGVTPIEASSGKTTRHRLNRGGDRRANAALYRITLSRLRTTNALATTSTDAPPKASVAAKPYAASNATSPARSST
jgi:transposase